MNYCTFYPEGIDLDVGTPITCPKCGHLVLVDLPHPDFSAPAPFTDEELTKLSLGN